MDEINVSEAPTPPSPIVIESEIEGVPVTLEIHIHPEEH